MTAHVRITSASQLHCPAARCTARQHLNLQSAYRDGQDMANCGEEWPGHWELIDLGYTPDEARYVEYGYKGLLP